MPPTVGPTAGGAEASRPRWWIFPLAALFLSFYVLLAYCDLIRPEPAGFVLGVDRSRMVVTVVAPASPAARAGLQVGDRVLTASSRPIRSRLDWLSVEMNLRVGQPLRLEVAQADSSRIVTLVLDGASRSYWATTAGVTGRDVPWQNLIEAADRARPSIERTARSVGDQKMQLAMREMRSHAGDSGYLAQSLVATWIGDYRLKTRPDHRGLISPEQLNELRAVLQPGDILLERRNWFMSNAFLPGFWPHAAVYLGDPAALGELGLMEDPRVVRHLRAFLAPDAAGDPHAVIEAIIEAISEGVVFTSLEHSVGQADAVAVLRPRLTSAERREAISRAFSHYGKPYDFEFDFFSTDRLVCTELVYRAYDGMVEVPLTRVLGRQAIPAMTFVRVYADTRGREDRPFDLVYVLDVDEDGGRAVAASEAVFLETLNRSGLTFLQ